MKPITKSKTPCNCQAPEPRAKAPAKPQAQCCAKVSTVTTGCHN